MEFVFSELVKPMVHRLGSALGIFLASSEVVTKADAQVLEAAFVILAGYGVDLIVRKVV